MPCMQMLELEASFNRLAERRLEVIPHATERRQRPVAGYRGRLARIAYLMQLHRQSCSECMKRGPRVIEFPGAR